MLKFRTRRWSNDIEPVECVRESDKSIWVVGPRGREERRLRDGDFSTFHDTWEGAHAHLLKRAEEKLESARLALSRAEVECLTVKGMKKPEALG